MKLTQKVLFSDVEIIIICPEEAYAKEVSSILSGSLSVTDNCILDGVLMRPKNKNNDAVPEDSADAAARVMVILDLLALNGRSLCECPLRERRTELTKLLIAAPSTLSGSSSEGDKESIPVT